MSVDFIDEAVFLVPGEVTQSIRFVTITSVTLGAISNNQMPVNIVAPGAQDGDDILWSLVPAGGGDAVAGNIGNPIAWPGATVTLPDGIPSASYVLVITVGDSAPFTSAAFTVDTIADPPTETFVYSFNNQQNVNNGGSWSWINLSGVAEGDDLWIAVNLVVSGQGGAIGLTLQGVAATPIQEVGPASVVAFFRIACPAAAAGNSGATIAVTNTGLGKAHIGIWKVEDATGFTVAGTSFDALSADMDLSGDVGAGVVLASAAFRDADVTGEVGLTRDFLKKADSDRSYLYLSAATTAETPRTMTIQNTSAGDRAGGVAIAIT